MNKYLLLALLLPTLVSCSKSGGEPDPDKPAPETVDPPVIIRTIEKFVVDKGLTFAHEKFNALGYGYDATGQQCALASVKGKAIDVDRLREDQNSTVTILPGASALGERVTGLTAAEFIPGLSGKHSIWMNDIDLIYYAGELGDRLDQKVIHDSQNSFVSKDIGYKKWKYSINTLYVKSHHEYLTDVFRNALLESTPAEIVEQFGTHILDEIYVGINLHMNFLCTMWHPGDGEITVVELDRETDKLMIEVFGDYATWGGMWTPNFPETEYKCLAPYMFYQTVGGDPALRRHGQIDFDKPYDPIDLAAWKKSFDEGPWEMIEIQGMVPVYKFIDDREKAIEVESYIRGLVNELRGK